MTLLKKNIIANFGGNIWTALMGLVFVPLYIHFMGIEAYGLFAALLRVFIRLLICFLIALGDQETTPKQRFGNI